MTTGGEALAGQLAPVGTRSRRTRLERLNTFLFRYHRWFGVVCCVAMMAWGASGVLHPLIGRLAPRAATMAPPPARLDLHALPEPGELLRRAGIDQVAGLRLVTVADAARPLQAWQVTLPGAARRHYFDATDGTPVHDGDARYAVVLARHFSGQRHSAIKSVRLVTRFDDDYLPGNRLLPVYRVDFDRPDGLRAYVDTSPPRLARLTDDSTAQLRRLFRVLHDWSFLDQVQALRVGLLSLLLAATLASAASGLWMYGFMWRRGTLGRRHRPLQRWHRVVGLAVSVGALGFAASAQWRLLANDPPAAPRRAGGAMAVAGLPLPPALRQGSWRSVALVRCGDGLCYRVQAGGSHDSGMAGHHHGAAAPPALYLDAASGRRLAGAERRHAVWLAGRFSGLADAQLQAVAPVTRFDGEYGFMNKRLPVWRVAYDTPDAAAFYVEPESGTLAAEVRRPDRLEGWSFAQLHMFHWLDFAGRDLRDAVLALFGFGHLLVAALGLWLFARRTRRRRSV